MADIFELFKQIAQKREEKERAEEPVSFIIAGLGNPGSEYNRTRHNTGFLAVDYIAKRNDVKITRSKFQSLCAECYISGRRALLLKPQTYMNLSGNAVSEAANFYKIPPRNIIILCDDIMLDVARLRVRRSGSDGGHNGIKNIILNLGTQEIPRVKIGVGQKPNPDYDASDWVLSTFTEKELDALEAAFPTVYRGVEEIISGNIENAMQFCNGYHPE